MSHSTVHPALLGLSLSGLLALSACKKEDVEDTTKASVATEPTPEPLSFTMLLCLRCLPLALVWTWGLGQELP